MDHFLSFKIRYANDVLDVHLKSAHGDVFYKKRNQEPYALVYLLDNVKLTWERHAKTWFQEHNRKTEVSKTFFWNHFFSFNGVNHLDLVTKSLVIAIWDCSSCASEGEEYIAGVRIPIQEVLNFDVFEFFDFKVNLQAQEADAWSRE